MTFARIRHDDDGVALVEFALVLPLLLLLLFGILDFGRVFAYWINGTHLTGEAARYAAVNRNPGGSGQSLQQYIQGQGATRELREGSSSVEEPLTISICFPAGGTPTKGDPVRVTATAEYRWLRVLGLDATTTTISSSSTMRLEATPTNFSADEPCPAPAT